MQRVIAKLIVTGPFNAGKSTLIQFLSDRQGAGTEVAASERANIKALTTVGLDFGILDVDETLEVHLFGTPGQARFNFMWKILSKGALGSIFLIDSSDSRSLEEAQKIFTMFKELENMPIVVGASKRDLPDAMPLSELAEYLNLGNVPILPCDPRDKESAKVLVLSLLQEILMKEDNAAVLEL
ncbi:MAG: GTP-binding protein [Mariprofundales bacterium]